MAEKIAGITMREIDQSQPVGVRPEGIPAGVIGTAAKGPAFVPVVFANTADFIKDWAQPTTVHECRAKTQEVLEYLGLKGTCMAVSTLASPRLDA